MAFRRPLFYSNGNLQQMTDTQIAEIRNQAFWLFVADPSVTLNVVASGGNLGTITESRLQAGEALSNPSFFWPESDTPEPTIVSINYSRINQSIATLSVPSNTNNVRFPAYYNADGNIQAMSLQDMYDTFIATALATVAADGALYTISSSTFVPGYNLAADANVFADTRADTSQYTFDGIPEVLDQPVTIANYYLHRRNNSSQSYTTPVVVDGAGNVRIAFNFDAVLQEVIRYAATAEVGLRLRYNYNGTGSNCGTGMTDTRLNGSGNYQAWQVNGDDYRSQEFPDGSPIVVNTYFLRSELV